MENEKLKALYNSLRSIDKDFTRTYDEFNVDMQDPNKRAKLHQNLSKIKPEFTRSYDEFSSDMGFGKPNFMDSEFSVVPKPNAPKQNASVIPSGSNGYSFLSNEEQAENKKKVQIKANFDTQLEEYKRRLYDKGVKGQQLEKSITDFYTKNGQELTPLQIQTFKDNAKAGGYDYEGDDNWFEDMGEKMLGTTKGLVGGILKSGQIIDDLIPDTEAAKKQNGGYSLLDDMSGAVNKEAEKDKAKSVRYGYITDENGQKKPKTFTDLFKEGRIVDGIGDMFLTGIGSGIPSSAMAMIPFIGMASLVAGSSGQQYEQLVNDPELAELPQWKKAIGAVGSGTIEGLVERLNVPLLNKGLKTFKSSIVKSLGKEVSEKVANEIADETIAKGIKGFIKKASENPLAPMVTETGEEVLTLGLQDAWGNLVGTKEGMSSGKDYLESAAYGLTGGSPYSALSLAGKGINAIGNKQTETPQIPQPEQPISIPQTPEQRIQQATIDAQSFVDNISNKGQVIEAKIKGFDQPVNITGGNVVLNEDGSLDRTKSDKTIIYKTPDGKAHPGNLDFVIDGTISITPSEEAVNQIIQPIKDQIDNEQAPEYEVGSKVVIKDKDGFNSIVTVTGRSQDGNYTFQSTDPSGQPVQGGFEPREVNPIFTGVFDGDNNVVEYTHPDTGLLTTGVLELDTTEAQQLFTQGNYAKIDGQDIPFANIKGQYINEDLQPTQQTEQPLQGEGQPAPSAEGAGEIQNLKPSQAEGEQVQVAYPTNKKGEIDFDNFTADQHYQYAVETEGETVAQQDLKDAIAAEYNKIQKHKKKIQDAPFEKKAALRQQLKTLSGKYDALQALKAKYIPEVQPEAVTRTEKPKDVQLSGFEAITERWNTAPKTEGIQDEIVLANGETITGRYILTQAGAMTPSHNPNGFAPSEGFPQVDGKTVNDRDYQSDTNAQTIVLQKAQQYDQRALQTPVIVSAEGVVLSGNDRTMAGQIAAQNGTDKAYVEYLAKYAPKYGFTTEQVAAIANPRVVFVPDVQMPYTTETFAKFNAEEKKTQNKTEAAVKVSKTIKETTVQKISTIVDRFDSLNELYSNQAATNEIIKALVADGVIGENEVAELMDGLVFSETGKDYIETIMIGSTLSEDALRSLSLMKGIRQNVVRAIIPIMNNRKLETYNLTKELSDAIKLIYQVYSETGTVPTAKDIDSYILQPTLGADFGASAIDLYDATVQVFAKTIVKGQNDLKKVVSLYNAQAVDFEAGQADMFSGILPKDELINLVLTQSGYGQEQSISRQSGTAGQSTGSETTNVTESDSGQRQESLTTKGESETTKEKVARLKSERLARGEKFEINEIPEVPQKYTTNLSVLELPISPEVPIDIIDLSAENDSQTDMSVVSKAKLIEVRGRNNDGKLVGTVILYDNEGFRLGEFEVKFKDKTPSSDTELLDANIAAQNPNVNPTDKQKESGAYNKARVNLQGYNITVETPKGAQRSGTDPNGKAWSITMNNHYGELDGTTGYDGDPIDVFIGDNPNNGQIFVVDQVNQDGTFDESKVMLGFDTAEEAKAAYMSNYEAGWQGFGNITPAGENFKAWLYDGKKQRKPFNEYKETPEAVNKSEQPLEKVEKPIRFQEGKKLTAEEKKEVIKSMKDSYKVMNRPSTFEADHSGVERFMWLENSNDYMTKSDITGRMLRWYIELPDGRIAHPTEVYPDLSRDEIQQAEYTDNAFIKSYEDTYAKGVKALEAQRTEIVNQLNKGLKAGLNFEKQYDSADIRERNPIVLLRTAIKTPENPNGMLITVEKYLSNNSIVIPKVNDFDWERYLNDNVEKAPENEGKDNGKVDEVLGKRNIWIPNMTKSKLSKLLNKETLTENDIEDLKDFKYFLLTDKESALEKGFYTKLLTSQQGDAYVLTDKFLLTNIENKLNQVPDIKNMVEKPTIQPGQSLIAHAKEVNEWNKEAEKSEAIETDSAIQNKTTSPKITATDEKIEDVGEKIGGAKKDLFQEYAKKLLSVTDQDIARLPLSKSFPRPNFAQLIEDGKMTQETAIFLNYFYDNIPSKPQKSYKVERWVKTVREALDTFNSVLENKPERDLMQEYIDMLNTNIMGQRKAFNAEVYRAVRKAINFPNNDVNVGNLTILRQQTSEGKYVYSVGSPVGNRVRLTGRFNTMEEAAAKLIEMAKETAGKPKQVEFSVYSSRSSGDFYITPKGKGEIVLQNGFKTSKEAFEYINENREALTDRFNAMKEIPSERRMSNKERVGFDYRQDKNVTAEDFGKEFGFRGVEFGNWVNQEERQAHINEAYDALMDLASVIGVTPRALSLNGELGFAFGSRGGGKYAAHYETDKVVINLTKTKGAGTLAHEWFHALDNYLLRAVGNKSSYATDGPGFNKEGKPALRPELNDAFRNLMKVIRKSGFYTRSAKLDKIKGSKYWGTSVELGARGFEDFVMNKLAKSNIQNDYLVNFKSLAEFIDRVNGDISEITSKYPYPTMEESEAISEAYQNLFDTIQEDDNAVLFQAISPSEEYDNAANAKERYNAAVEMVAEMDAQNGTKTIIARDNEDFISMLPEKYADFARKNRIGAVLYKGTLIINQVNQVDADAIIVAYEHENAHIANNAVHTREELSELWDNVTESERRLVPKVYSKMDQHVKGDELITYAIEDIIKKQGYDNYKNGNIDFSLYSEALQNKLKKTIDYANNKYLANNGRRIQNGSTTDGRTIGRFQQVNGEGTRTGNRGTTNGTDQLAETVEQLLKTGLAKEVRMVTPEEIAGILEGNEQLHAVYHGSPHSFDKFSLDKIGTGEGAQAYGWGLYFTDKKAIAESYAENLRPKVAFDDKFSFILDGKQLSEKKRHFIRTYFDSYFENLKDLKQRAEYWKNEFKRDISNGYYDKYPKHIYEKDLYLYKLSDEILSANLYEVIDNSKTPTNLYTVKIHGDKSIEELNFLRWDKPFREQTQAVKDAFNKGFSIESFDADYETVGDFYKTRAYIKGAEAVSKELLALGIDGIQYPANFTTGKANETDFNYVVFDDSAVEITEHVKFMRTPTGTIYGFVKGGVVYLNSETPNLNTPIHEFGHLWIDAIEGSDVYNRGAALVKNTPYWERVNSDPNYKDLSETARIKEAMAMAIGDKGEAVKQNLGLYARVKVWIRDVWKRIGAQFGIQNLTPEQIQNLTFADFVDVAVSELMAGENLAKKNNLDENALSLQAPTKVEKSNENYQEYKTQSGEVIPYVSERQLELSPIAVAPNSNVQQQANTTTSEYNSIDDTSDDVTHFERLMSEQKHIKLSGATKIKSSSDVAYLFRSLESSPVENVFAVLRNDSGTYKVLYLSSGATNQSVVDIKLIAAAVKEFGATSVTLVHNHPSGSLQASNADKSIQKQLRASLNGNAIVLPGVIINLDSGKYLEFDTDFESVENRPEQSRTGKETNAKVYAFDRQKLYTKSENLSKIRSSKDVAIALSKFKRGTTEKYIVLILDGQNRIVRTFLTDDITSKNLIPIVGKHGQALVIGSNTSIQKDKLQNIKSDLEQARIQLLDYVKVGQDPSITTAYTSYADEGYLYEPKPKYQQAGFENESIGEYAQRRVEYNEQRFIDGIVREEREKEAEAAIQRGETPIAHEMAMMELDMSLRTAYDKLGAIIGMKAAKSLERKFGNKEMWQDAKLPVKVFLDYLRSKGANITAMDDYHLQSTHLQGKNDTAWNDYLRRLAKPLNKFIKETIKKTGYTFRDVENYAMLKHGIERNAEMKKKNAETELRNKFGLNKIESKINALNKRITKSNDLNKTKLQEELDKLTQNKTKITVIIKAQLKGVKNILPIADAQKWYDKRKSTIDTLLKNNKIDNKTFEKRLKKLDAIYNDGLQAASSHKDYSGFYAIAAELYAKQNGLEFDPTDKNSFLDVLKAYAADNGIILESKNRSGVFDELIEKSNLKDDFDQLANDYISDFENTMNDSDQSIDKFWELINSASDFSIDQMYRGGLISKQEMEDTKSRYKYYIPLRGHEAEAEKQYDYTPDMGVFFSPAMIGAKGRVSRAENPFGYMLQMAQSAIVAKNRNLLNQTLLRVARADKTGLISYNKTWYIKTGTDAEGKEIWEEAEIDLQNDSEVSRAEFEAWEARMKEKAALGEAKQLTKGVEMEGLFIKKNQKKQHAVSVSAGGVEYQVYINGNPKVSRAINGLNKSEQQGFLSFLSQAKSVIGKNVTTRNPAFMASNFSRDIIFATTMLGVNEGAAYTANFLKNVPLAFKELAQYQINPDKAPAHVREFFDNGAETGFSHLFELQDLQKQIDKAVLHKTTGKDVFDIVVTPIDIANKIIENATRLATYKTSRESGRTIVESVSNAKEVTTNFNTKGAGGGITDFVRSAYLFINAAVQGLNVLTRTAKAHPIKFSAVLLSYAMTGLMMPLINALLSGDDDEYWNLPDWDRQNNLCIWVGTGFAKIPLPQGLRAFHRIGDNAAAYVMGRKELSETLVSSTEGMMDILPLNPMGMQTGNSETTLFVRGIEGITPDAIKPISQIALNRTFTGSQIAIDRAYVKAGVPEWRQAKTNRAGEPKAPSGIILIAKTLNSIGEGTDAKSGSVDINPDRLTHLMRGYMGGIFNIAQEPINSITKRFYIGEKDLNEKATGGNLGAAYKKIDAAQERMNQYNQLKKDVKEKTINMAQYSKEISTLDLRHAKQLTYMGNKVATINKLLKDPTLTEENKESLRVLQKQLLQTIDSIELK